MGVMTVLYVDADACPVKEEVYRVARRYALPVKVVANAFLMVPSEPLIERVIYAPRIQALINQTAHAATTPLAVAV